MLVACLGGPGKGKKNAGRGSGAGNRFSAAHWDGPPRRERAWKPVACRGYFPDFPGGFRPCPGSTDANRKTVWKANNRRINRLA